MRYRVLNATRYCILNGTRYRVLIGTRYRVLNATRYRVLNGKRYRVLVQNALQLHRNFTVPLAFPQRSISRASNAFSVRLLLSGTVSEQSRNALKWSTRFCQCFRAMRFCQCISL